MINSEITYVNLEFSNCVEFICNENLPLSKEDRNEDADEVLEDVDGPVVEELENHCNDHDGATENINIKTIDIWTAS